MQMKTISSVLIRWLIERSKEEDKSGLLSPSTPKELEKPTKRNRLSK
jgi:hypothetical protein